MLSSFSFASVWFYMHRRLSNALEKFSTINLFRLETFRGFSQLSTPFVILKLGDLSSSLAFEETPRADSGLVELFLKFLIDKVSSEWFLRLDLIFKSNANSLLFSERDVSNTNYKINTGIKDNGAKCELCPIHMQLTHIVAFIKSSYFEIFHDF